MLTHIHGSIELIRKAQAFHGGSRCKTCPVASAIKQVLKPEYDVLVTSRDIVITYVGGKWLHTYGPGDKETDVPPGHYELVTSFDAPNRPIGDEFSFDMDIPQEYLRDV